MAHKLSALFARLSQYPPGTRFNCKPFNGGGAAEQQALAELRQYLEGRGMRLVEN